MVNRSRSAGSETTAVPLGLCTSRTTCGTGWRCTSSRRADVSNTIGSVADAAAANADQSQMSNAAENLGMSFLHVAGVRGSNAWQAFVAEIAAGGSRRLSGWVEGVIGAQANRRLPPAAIVRPW